MKTLEIQVKKSEVYEEVQKLTSYIGSKGMGEDAGSYDRIAAVDADRELLEQYWSEASSLAENGLKRWLLEVSDNRLGHHSDLSRSFTATLRMPEGYDSVLDGSVQSLLTGYFINHIAGRWLGVSSGNAEASAGYLGEASSLLEGVRRQLYHKKRPER